MTTGHPLAVKLVSRAVIRVSGPEARPLLQGLISNNIDRATDSNAIYAALLTPQGKFLADFMIVGHSGALLFDCEAARKDDLLRRLMMYRLRAKADIDDVSSDFAVWAIIGDQTACQEGAAEPCCDGVVYCDPRLAALGRRAILPAGKSPRGADDMPGTEEDYDRHRLALGVPDGSRDIAVEKRLMLEANFEELNGVDFRKGCYVGQELAARMKYRGRVRKRLIPVNITGSVPGPGAEVLLDGKPAGEIYSGLDDRAIALLRVEDLGKGEFRTADGNVVIPDIPDWLAPGLAAKEA